MGLKQHYSCASDNEPTLVPSSCSCSHNPVFVEYLGISLSPLFSPFSPLKAPSPDEPCQCQSTCAGWQSAISRAACSGGLALKPVGSRAQHGSVLDPVCTALGPRCESTTDCSAVKSQKVADDAALLGGLSSSFWGLSGRCSLGLYPRGEALLASARPPVCPAVALASQHGGGI